MKEKPKKEDKQEIYEREKGALQRKEWEEDASDAEMVSKTREAIQVIDRKIETLNEKIRIAQEKLDAIAGSIKENKHNEDAESLDEHVRVLEEYISVLQDTIAFQRSAKEGLENDMLHLREISLHIANALRPDERLQ